jgi:hypothetical protein
MATGLGSPNASALAPELCVQTLRLADPGSQRSFLHSSTALTLNAAAGTGVALRFAARGLPKGLSIDPGTGRISGRPARLGTATVTIVAYDQSASRSASFAWTVENRPRVTGAALTSVAAGRPSLTLKLAAGRGAPPLQAVQLVLPNGLAFTARPRPQITGGSGKRLPSSTAVRDGALDIALRSGSRVVEIAIGSRDLKTASSLISAVARGRRARLTLRLIAADSAGTVATIAVTLVARS